MPVMIIIRFLGSIMESWDRLGMTDHGITWNHMCFSRSELLSGHDTMMMRGSKFVRSWSQDLTDTQTNPIVSLRRHGIFPVLMGETPVLMRQNIIYIYGKNTGSKVISPLWCWSNLSFHRRTSNSKLKKPHVLAGYSLKFPWELPRHDSLTCLGQLISTLNPLFFLLQYGTGVTLARVTFSPRASRSSNQAAPQSPAKSLSQSWGASRADLGGLWRSLLSKSPSSRGFGRYQLW